MPAEASIYGLIRPQPEVAFVPPEERQLRQVRLRQLLGEEEMRRMQIDEARRGVETNRRIQDFFSTNPNATPDQLAPIDYKAAEALRKARLEEEAKRANIGKDKASAEKDQFQVAIDKLKYGASILSNAKDQQSYDMVVRMMANTFGPNAIEKFPAQFDPLFVKTAIDRGITRQQQLEDERARATAAETGRHNIETEQTARGNLAVSQGTLANARERLQFEKEQPKGVYDPERGILVDPRTATSQPVMAGGAPIGPKKDKADEVQRTMDMYVAARNGLLAGLEGSMTGPIVGRGIPFTAAQQVAEGGVAAMAPVLKQLFRVAGEGTFTDKDQELLLKMVPTRADDPKAREKKIANIDQIVSAKLGLSVPAPQQAQGKIGGGVLTPNADGSFSYGSRKP